MDAARKASILYHVKNVKELLLDPTPGSEFNPAYAILRGGLVQIDIFSVPYPAATQLLIFRGRRKKDKKVSLKAS